MDRNSKEAKSKQYMLKNTIQSVAQRYKIIVETGEVWGPRGGRVDNYQFHKTSTYSNGGPRYKQVQLSFEGGKVDISAHILIWAFHNGRWPRDGYAINHINSDTDDNRIVNLDEITIAENAKLGKRWNK